MLVSLMMSPSMAASLEMFAPETDDPWLAEGEYQEVSIATGAGLPISRAPAVASVITADEIEAMGATDIDTVLETVPGLHLARSTQGDTPLYVIRGINLGFNPQVLMLINGVPITSVYTGNRGSVWGDLPVQHVARIEVIRGPGSALYGADAFAGVINVITKTATEIGGSEVGLKVGSFDTQDAWFMHGGTWGRRKLPPSCAWVAPTGTDAPLTPTLRPAGTACWLARPSRWHPVRSTMAASSLTGMSTCPWMPGGCAWLTASAIAWGPERAWPRRWTQQAKA